jgi:alkylation response protein AidB-like acyl-CoA dehydrogenase
MKSAGGGGQVATTQVTDEAATVGRRLAERFAEGAAERDLNRVFPHEQLEELRTSGLEALLVPKEYGGWGGSWSDVVRVVEILATGDPNIAQIYLIHTYGVMFVEELPSKELAKNLYERTVAGQLRWANAYSELSTKNVFAHTVKLSRSASGYQLNGKKFYSTGSLGGDEFYVTAVVDGSAEVQLALVPANAPGLTIIDDWSGMGQVTTSSGTVQFENVHVPADRILPLAPFEEPTNLLDPVGRLMLSGIYLGIARNALSDTIQYVRNKARPWAHSTVERASEDPYVLVHVGEMQTLVTAAAAIQNRAIDYLDAALAAPSRESRARAAVAISEANAFATNTGLKVCEMLFQVCGSSSTLKKYNYSRHWRNVRTLTLHDPVDYKFKLIGEYYLLDKNPPVFVYTRTTRT